MRLPRMTTRRWMIAVAAVAILIQIVRLSATSYDRWQSAYSHQLFADTMRTNVDAIRRWIARSSSQGAPSAAIAEEKAALARDQEWAEYCAGLATKYRRAARYPWLPVEPDPPPPN